MAHVTSLLGRGAQNIALSTAFIELKQGTLHVLKQLKNLQEISQLPSVVGSLEHSSVPSLDPSLVQEMGNIAISDVKVKQDPICVDPPNKLIAMQQLESLYQATCLFFTHQEREIALFPVLYNFIDEFSNNQNTVEILRKGDANFFLAQIDQLRCIVKQRESRRGGTDSWSAELFSLDHLSIGIKNKLEEEKCLALEDFLDYLRSFNACALNFLKWCSIDMHDSFKSLALNVCSLEGDLSLISADVMPQGDPPRGREVLGNIMSSTNLVIKQYENIESSINDAVGSVIGMLSDIEVTLGAYAIRDSLDKSQNVWSLPETSLMNKVRVLLASVAVNPFPDQEVLNVLCTDSANDFKVCVKSILRKISQNWDKYETVDKLDMVSFITYFDRFPFNGIGTQCQHGYLYRQIMGTLIKTWEIKLPIESFFGEFVSIKTELTDQQVSTIFQLAILVCDHRLTPFLGIESLALLIRATQVMMLKDNERWMKRVLNQLEAALSYEKGMV